MSQHDGARPLQASVVVTASPAQVWSVISDVARTGDWSPECRRVVPLGTVRAGTYLCGINQRGRVRWATLSRIVRFEPGQEFRWKVLTNRSQWAYQLEATGEGTYLTETRRTPDGVGRFARWFTSRFLGGQHDHDDELESGMSSGLQKIKKLIEV